MDPSAGGNNSRPDLRNPGERKDQVGSQFDQNEYVSQDHDEYGGMPPPIAPPQLVVPVEPFASGSTTPEFEAPVPSPDPFHPRNLETPAAHLSALFNTKVQLAVEKQRGQFSHHSVMPPSPAIRSQANGASVPRSPFHASKLISMLLTEPTVVELDTLKVELRYR